MTTQVEKVAPEAMATPAEPTMEEKEVVVESRTGFSFPKKLSDGKVLATLGLRKKNLIAFQLKIYSFGLYADDGALAAVLKHNNVLETAKPAVGKAAVPREVFEAVIDSDAGITVRMVMSFGGLTMGTVRKNFDEGLGGSMKKLAGRKDEELLNKVMGGVSDNLKLPPGSTIEITRLPGYTLQTKVKGEVISSVQSELLCRSYFHLYLGDDPFDKEAKEHFGEHLLTLIA